MNDCNNLIKYLKTELRIDLLSRFTLCSLVPYKLNPLSIPLLLALTGRV